MPNSLQSSAIGSPASRRATNCIRSSVTEHSFQGIFPSLKPGGSVTHVSGTMCYLCLRPLNFLKTKTLRFFRRAQKERIRCTVVAHWPGTVPELSSNREKKSRQEALWRVQRDRLMVYIELERLSKSASKVLGKACYGADL